ncbi:MAG: hypothetical protein ABR540_00360 [Acidimicrobiales bacterium]|nr:hypothetical protein [Actinomycetota bacterium]
MPAATNGVFREKNKVEAADDELRGVPAGTPGVVIGVSGLSWIRYRVLFGNGVERNLVDAKHLRPRD